MRTMIGALALLALGGCAWNPIMTPYALGPASTAAPEGTATVWGTADESDLYFRSIDGKALPSRGGGGYPISLSLLPGSYEVGVYFTTLDHRSTAGVLPIMVEAGHTYVVRHKFVQKDTRVSLILEDLGTTTKCHYERYEHLSGNALLICQ